MTDQFLPDSFGAMTSAFGQGQQMRAQRQAGEQRNRLAALAPQVLNGDPTATAQAYAIDPAAAKQYGEGAERLGLQLHNIANQIKQMHAAGNEQGAAMLYQQAAPMIRQKFPNAPAQWDPTALMPAIDAVVAMTAQGDKEQRNLAVSPGSAIVDPATGKVIYERPFAPANAQYVDVPDGHGGMVKMTYDPQTRQLAPINIQGQGAAPQGPQGMQQVQYTTSDGQPIPQEDQAAVQAAFAADARGQDFHITASPGGQPQGVPVAGGGSGTGGMGYTPPKSETAAEKAANWQIVQGADGSFFRVNKLDGRAEPLTSNGQAVQGANQIRQAEQDQKRAEALSAVNGTIESIDTTLASVKQLLSDPGRAAGTGMSAMLPAIPGSSRKDFDAHLATLKAQTFLPMVAALKGMGALSDAEGKKLTEAVGALDPQMGEVAFEKSLYDIQARLYRARANASNRIAALKHNTAHLSGDTSNAPAVPQGGWSIQAVP